MNVLLFLLAVPLTIEFIGRLLSVRDNWPLPAERPAALQRLAWPLAAWILLLWLGTPEHAAALGLAVAVVAGVRLTMLLTMRALSRLPRSRPLDSDEG